MANTLMTLGSYRFSIDTAAFQTLQRSSRYQWQAQARFNRKPAQQFTGPDADTLSLEGQILPHFRGGLKQIDAMREQAGKGEPLLLTDGQGNVWGQWCITGINETHSDLTNQGAPRHIRFRMELVEYGDDNPDRQRLITGQSTITTGNIA